MIVTFLLPLLLCYKAEVRHLCAAHFRIYVYIYIYLILLSGQSLPYGINYLTGIPENRPDAITAHLVDTINPVC